MMAVDGLGSNPGLEGLIGLAGMLRLNSRSGTEGLPVISLNCDRLLHSGIRAPETIMSMGGQITVSVRP